MVIYRPIKTDYLVQGFGDNKACALAVNGVTIRPFRVVSSKNGVCPINSTPFYPEIGLKGHNGWDNAAYHGEPLYFPVDESGMTWTAYTERDADGGIGVDVFSDRPIGGAFVKFRFWHLKETNVHDGEKVKFGQLLGRCDNTGASSGDHLHWSMKVCDNERNTLNTENGYSGAVDFSGFYRNNFVGDVVKLNEAQLSLIDLLNKLIIQLKIRIQKVGSSIKK